MNSEIKKRKISSGFLNLDMAHPQLLYTEIFMGFFMEIFNFNKIDL